MANILKAESKKSCRYFEITRLVAMRPYLLPVVTYNGDVLFAQNSAMYPSAYLHRELTTRNYAGEYRHDEPVLETNMGEYHRDENRFMEGYHLADHAAKNYAGEYHPNDPAVKNYIGEYHPNDPATKNYFGEYHHHNELTTRKDKEDYFDEVLRNAHKSRRARMKNVVASGLASNPMQRGYLRSLKRKKLKSFMVRDLIDLPADENHPDVCDANNQYQNMLLNPALTPPPETAIPWKKYGPLFPEDTKPCSNSVGNKPELHSPDAVGVSCLMNELEPSYLDTTRSSDTRSEPLHPDPTRTCYTFISSEPASRIPTPESQGTNSDVSSVDGAASPCGKAKRVRTIFSCSQLERLEIEFERTHYMVGSERSQLASELKLRESQVKVWFQNRRIKHRKQFHEEQQAMLSKLKESQDSQAEFENDANKENSLTSTWSEESSS